MINGLYFDCFAGVSGDMLLGALVDIGVPKQHLVDELKKLPVTGYEVIFEETAQKGIGGTKCTVNLIEKNQPTRFYNDIAKIILESSLSHYVKDKSLAVFKIISEAEGKVHRIDPQRVHFHEVGAVDSIVDIVGTIICIDYLKPQFIYTSPINTGSGFVKCAHGILPVPAPATAEILSNSKLRQYAQNINGEAATPTGVALLSALATPVDTMPVINISKVALGHGQRDFGGLNSLRVYLGTLPEKSNQTMMLLETNIDDMTGEELGHLMNLLLENGALDVYFTQIQMKKNRPAIKISVIAQEPWHQLEALLFANTTTLGVRRFETTRTCINRKVETLESPYGIVQVKYTANNPLRFKFEYEDLKRISENTNKSIIEIKEQLIHWFIEKHKK